VYRNDGNIQIKYSRFINRKFSPSEKEANPAKDKISKIIAKKQTPSFAKKFISEKSFL
jgi:hypothetical protein